MTNNPNDYETHHSHSHCWEQKQPPACGMKGEHKICCLCGLERPNNPHKELREKWMRWSWENTHATTEEDIKIADFWLSKLSSALTAQKEKILEIVGEDEDTTYSNGDEGVDGRNQERSRIRGLIEKLLTTNKT